LEKTKQHDVPKIDNKRDSKIDLRRSQNNIELSQFRDSDYRVDSKNKSEIFPRQLSSITHDTSFLPNNSISGISKFEFKNSVDSVPKPKRPQSSSVYKDANKNHSNMLNARPMSSNP